MSISKTDNRTNRWFIVVGLDAKSAPGVEDVFAASTCLEVDRGPITGVYLDAGLIELLEAIKQQRRLR